MNCLSWGFVLSLWVRKKIFEQYLCLKHTKLQFHIVLFVRNWLLKSVSYLIFFCNSSKSFLTLPRKVIEVLEKKFSTIGFRRYPRNVVKSFSLGSVLSPWARKRLLDNFCV